MVKHANCHFLLVANFFTAILNFPKTCFLQTLFLFFSHNSTGIKRDILTSRNVETEERQTEFHFSMTFFSLVM